jgi:hypothetical protein
MNVNPVGEPTDLPCFQKMGWGIAVAVSLVALVVIGVGIAAYGAQAGWWESSLDLSQMTAVVMIASGGGAAALLLLVGSSVIGINAYLSKKHSPEEAVQDTNTVATKSANSIANVKAQFKELTVMGKQEWKDIIGLDVQEPPIPQNIIDFLMKHGSSEYTLFLMPQSLEIQHFVGQIKTPKLENYTGVNIVIPWAREGMQHEAKKPYWILASPVNRGEGQYGYDGLKSRLSHSGLVLPQFYEALFLLSMQYAKSQGTVKNRNPICCEGTYEGNTHAILAWPGFGAKHQLMGMVTTLTSTDLFGVVR